jgi:hypothetical protein
MPAPDLRVPVKASSIMLVFVALSLTWSISVFSNWGTMGVAPIVLSPVLGFLFCGWLLERPYDNLVTIIICLPFIAALNFIPISFFKSGWNIVSLLLLVFFLGLPMTVLSHLICEKLRNTFRIARG